MQTRYYWFSPKHLAHHHHQKYKKERSGKKLVTQLDFYVNKIFFFLLLFYEFCAQQPFSEKYPLQNELLLIAGVQ